MLGGDFLSAGKDLAGVILHDFIILFAHQSLSDDFLFRDVHVVAFVGLGGRRDDGFGETLVFLHALGQFYTAELTASLLVFTPCRAGEYRADNHFHAETLALQTNSDHRVGGGQFPVGTDIRRLVKEFGGNLVEHLSFERNAFGQNHVESRNSVGCHHHHDVVVDVVNVAYLTVVNAFLSIKMEISACQCFHCLEDLCLVDFYYVLFSVCFLLRPFRRPSRCVSPVCSSRCLCRSYRQTICLSHP